MQREYILTFDLGTTAIKMVIFDRNINAIYTDDYPLKTYERDGHQVQKAEDWWEGIKTLCMRLKNDDKINRKRIAAISSTGQMEDCLLLDVRGEPLTEVLLYSDGRAEKECELLKELFGKDYLERITGNNFDPLMSINKYLYLRENRADLFSKHSYLITGAKDFLNFRLTGNNITDYTNAATTGFLDITRGEWNTYLLEELNLDRSFLPHLQKASSMAGSLSDRAAAELNLPAGIPVINGAGDLGASTLGAGALKEGDIYCYLGTTGWLATPAGSVSANKNIFSLSNVDGNGYILAGAILNAGKTYDWYLLKILAAGEKMAQIPAEEYRRVEERISSIPAGSEGILFFPFLSGERSPVKIKENNGGFIGLGTKSGRYEMLRAVLEGVGFSLKHNLREMLGEEEHPRQINMIGGGSRSNIWPQILADILNLDINILELKAGAPSLGAALIAFRALGWIDDYDEIKEGFAVKGRFHPVKENVREYVKIFARYLSYLEKLYL